MNKFFGTPHRAVFAMAIVIIIGTLSRAYLFAALICHQLVPFHTNHRFRVAVEEQPKSELLLAIPYHDIIALGINVIGTVLVLASTYQLGLANTYMGAPRS